MTHFKIITTTSDYPDVLLVRDRDENGEEIVRIVAVGTIDGQSNMFASSKVSFDCWQDAMDFINDFSSDSANKWCERQKISYWDVSAY